MWASTTLCVALLLWAAPRKLVKGWKGKNVRFYDFSIKSVVKASKGTKNKGLLLLL